MFCSVCNFFPEEPTCSCLRVFLLGSSSVIKSCSEVIGSIVVGFTLNLCFLKSWPKTVEWVIKL